MFCYRGNRRGKRYRRREIDEQQLLIDKGENKDKVNAFFINQFRFMACFVVKRILRIGWKVANWSRSLFFPDKITIKDLCNNCASKGVNIFHMKMGHLYFIRYIMF